MEKNNKVTDSDSNKIILYEDKHINAIFFHLQVKKQFHSMILKKLNLNQ